jgi:uncharacterized protein (DUF1810 family)
VIDDGSDLARFVLAQEGVHEQALAELLAGRKQTHWMWFVFPQIAGLGRSEMSRRYAIASLSEARAFLTHPILGRRLRRCAEAVLAHRGESAESIFGPIDAVKFRSCLTLFDRVAMDDELFAHCVRAFYAGQRHPATLEKIRLG